MNCINFSPQKSAIDTLRKYADSMLINEKILTRNCDEEKVIEALNHLNVILRTRTLKK